MMNMDERSQIRLMRHINTMCARSDPDHLGRLLKRKTSVIVYQRHAHRLSHKHTHTHVLGDEDKGRAREKGGEENGDHKLNFY